MTVTDVAPETAVFRLTVEITGASKEIAGKDVPETAATVSDIGRMSDLMLDPDRQLTEVELLQDAVLQSEALVRPLAVKS